MMYLEKERERMLPIFIIQKRKWNEIIIYFYAYIIDKIYGLNFFFLLPPLHLIQIFTIFNSDTLSTLKHFTETKFSSIG